MSNLLSLKYVTKYRFASYRYQIKEVMLTEPANVLEIGIGPNLVTGFLTQHNVRVVTMDRERHLNPQLAGTILHLPIKDITFDTVLCCQVLEHLPFQEFNNCLKELRSDLSGSGLFVSSVFYCVTGLNPWWANLTERTTRVLPDTIIC